MKTKQKTQSSRSGGTLVIVMAVLIAFSLMVMALLGVGKYSAYEIERDLLTTRARWIAEAGVEVAKAEINAGKDEREDIDEGYNFGDVALEDPEDFPDVGKGQYQFGICRTEGSEPVNDNFYIVSVGTAVSPAGESITVTNRVWLDGSSMALPFALAGMGGNSYVKQARSTEVDGDVYIEGYGDVNVIIDGVVQDADDGYAVDYVSTTQLVDPIVMIPFDQTEYNNLLTEAETRTPPGSGPGNSGGEAVPYTGPFSGLGTDTLYVNGDVHITEDIDSSLTIVATGNITFTANGKTVGEGVKLVAGGNINIDKNSMTFNENTTLFSKNDIHIGGNQNYPDVDPDDPDNPGMAILAMNDIVVEANVQGLMLLYAANEVKLVNGTQEITGSIIAGEGFDIRSNADITYTNSVFTVDTGIEFEQWFAQKQEWAQSPFPN